MGLTMAIISAVIWGFTPIWTYYMGGKPIQQLLGTTYGALVVGIILYLVKRPEITISGFIWCALAGAGWSLGQLTQYTAFKRLSTSTTVPIVAGIQLVFVNLAGVLFFGSWRGTVALTVGMISILVIILGVILSTRAGQSQESSVHEKAKTRDILLVMLGTGVGYGLCSVLPKIPEASGWATFPPQAIGMLLTALAFALCNKKTRKRSIFFGKSTLKNIVTGFNSGTGTFDYLDSIVMIGLSTGFTISQMNVVVSSVAGLLFMHENKHGKRLFNTIAGLVLVVIGGIAVGFLR